eukprot:308364-Rhodomonas_salina.1
MLPSRSPPHSLSAVPAHASESDSLTLSPPLPQGPALRHCQGSLCNHRPRMPVPSHVPRRRVTAGVTRPCRDRDSKAMGHLPRWHLLSLSESHSHSSRTPG